MRERRITMEIIVGACDTHERAMGWYYYLQEQLNFPFTATCTVKRAISPLRVKDEVQVIGMPSEDECEHEMFVTIRWEKDGLAVPLAQLRPIKATHTRTKRGAEGWHYWVKMGYELDRGKGNPRMQAPAGAARESSRRSPGARRA